MPCHSNSEDRADAELIANHYGFEMINYDLTDTYDAFKEQLSTNNISATEDEILNSDLRRKNTEGELKKAGYFIDDMAVELAKLYKEL